MKKERKKRKYNGDPRSKILNGQPWEVLVKLDADNAVNLLDEVEELGLSKTKNYSALINKRLAKSYHEHPAK